jgi:cyclopropane fatty-acyl-phospholipid synthase-like methyltransferase
VSAGGNQVDYDAELRLHNEVLLQACGVGPGDHVVDIGCGTGQTTPWLHHHDAGVGATGIHQPPSKLSAACAKCWPST